MQRYGWILLFHDCIVEQLQQLHAAAERVQRSDPAGYKGHANVKLLRALAQVILEVVPVDPARDEYCQGRLQGPKQRHWRSKRFGGHFRLFFRYDSRSKTIVFAWVCRESDRRSRVKR